MELKDKESMYLLKVAYQISWSLYKPTDKNVKRNRQIWIVFFYIYKFLIILSKSGKIMNIKI